MSYGAFRCGGAFLQPRNCRSVVTVKPYSELADVVSMNQNIFLGNQHASEFEIRAGDCAIRVVRRDKRLQDGGRVRFTPYNGCGSHSVASSQTPPMLRWQASHVPIKADAVGASSYRRMGRSATALANARNRLPRHRRVG